MKKTFLTFLFAVLSLPVFASGGAHLDKVAIDLDNQESLQNGARLFVDYCLSCHSASYMRYNRMAQDIGLSEDELKKNYMFAAEKVGETMSVAMSAEDAKGYFGTKVPDLSVIARARGADWLYTYLRTFYLDPSRPWGVNNATFKDVGMPHVLWELQGLKKAVYETHEDHEGKEVKVITGYETVIPGKLSEEEYDNAVRDLVNYLVYMGEPAKMQRYSLGVKVLIFLAIFFVFAYALKKEYWKDVH